MEDGVTKGSGMHGDRVELGVNIDHVATLRQARRTTEPDPVRAAVLAELGGADGITVHLREDRRHIQDRDVRVLRETLTVKLNLEMACEAEITRIAIGLKPDQVTLVPEKREEITTEGGLDCASASGRERVRRTLDALRETGIFTSLFLDPDLRQIDAAAEIGADAVEIHTGAYAVATTTGAPVAEQRRQLELVMAAAKQIRLFGMALHAGHGLTYLNVVPIAGIDGMRELNIGHSIMARAILTGMQEAVREMRRLLENG